MKNKLTMFILLLIGSKNIYSQCTNGDIEMGNFTGFNLYIGNNDGNANTLMFNDLSSFISGTGVTPIGIGIPPNANLGLWRHLITSAGFDPVLTGAIGSNINPVNLSMVFQGNHSIRLGNSDRGYTYDGQVPHTESEILSYDFTLNSSKTLTFSWASVLHDGHSTGRPFFGYWISKTNVLANSSSTSNLILNRDFEADTGNPLWQGSDAIPYPDAPDPVIYRKWHQECISMADMDDLREGDRLTIYFITADCAYAGHFGYAYLDNICVDEVYPCFKLLNKTCKLDDIIADASCSEDPNNDYWWEIVKLNSNDPNDVISTTGSSSYPHASGEIIGVNGDYMHPLKSFVSQTYNNFGPGYYRITLVFQKCSGEKVRYSLVIEINAPVISSKNVMSCCNAPATLTAHVDIFDQSVGQFTWYDENGHPASNSTNSTTTIDFDSFGNPIGATSTFHPPLNQSGKFIIKYLTYEGCEGYKEVYLIYVGQPNFKIVNEECYPGTTLYWDEGSEHMTNSIICGPRKMKVVFDGYTKCEGDGWPRESLANYYVWNDFVSSFYSNGLSFTYLWSPTGQTTDEIMMLNQSGDVTYSCTITTPCGQIVVSKIVDAFYYHTSFPSWGNSPGHIYCPTTTIAPSGVNSCITIYNVGYPTGYKPSYNAVKYLIESYNQWGQLCASKIGFMPCDGFANGDIKLCASDYFPGKLHENDTYGVELFLWNCESGYHFQFIKAWLVDAIY